ncbi:MAG: glycosyltransferase family 4 protein [Firmicutes bacterium]|nr:glycosyltransferase family 4 protein [Bacillota bacterium]
MNILVIPSWYPNGTDKLMGIYHKEFSAALANRKDINVNMLYIDRQRLNAPIKYLFMKKNEIIEETGYKTYIKKMLDVHKINFDWQMKRYYKVLEKAFKLYLKDNPKPDVLHAHVTLPAGYAVAKLGKKYNIPVVVTEHASYFKRFFEGKNKKYGDYVLGNSYFTTVSNFMAKEINKLGYKCDIIPNLVDTDIFVKDRKKVKELRIVTVSALRDGKRIDDIIKALKIIVEQGKIKDIELTIIGDGFLENYYKQTCKELNMDKYVTFVGRKTKEEISDILFQNNVFVIASEMETFCIPGVEALASGIPVVATRCLGPEEYINDRCGILVDVGDYKAMADAIVQVYNNSDKYDISYMRGVASNYASKSVTDKAIKIYKKINK